MIINTFIEIESMEGMWNCESTKSLAQTTTNLVLLSTYGKLLKWM